MTLGLAFWIIMLVWLVLGVWHAGFSVPNLVLFLLLGILGWHSFGPPIHG